MDKVTTSYKYLDSIDIRVFLNINIDLSVMCIEEIDRAWAEGHIIVVKRNNYDGDLELVTVNNRCVLGKDDVDITRDWLLYRKRLIDKQFPEEWTAFI